jgi:hypothetical protein
MLKNITATDALWLRDLGPVNDPQPGAIRLAAQDLDPPRRDATAPSRRTGAEEPGHLLAAPRRTIAQ